MYNHGVKISEVPTSIVPPARVSAGLPVVVGTAPVHMSEDGVGKLNEPVLAFTYQEAVQALGYHPDFASFTLCEAVYAFFALYAVGPVVLVNVLDTSVHKADVAAEAGAIDAYDQYKLVEQHPIPSSVVVKNNDGTTTYVLGTDYTFAVDDDGYGIVTRVESGTIAAAASIQVDYSTVDATAVDSTDVIGGIDAGTGKASGLELVNTIFPKFRQIPGQILAPKFSTDPTVAAIMHAKAANINQHFKAIALADVPTDTVINYTDVPAWKNDNNYVDELLVACWPKVALGDLQFHLSTQVAAANLLNDAANDDIPYRSPSNTGAQMNAAVLADGTEVELGPDQGAFLNGEGIVTALNFIGGWKIWGNRTGAYPDVTDPKDTFIPIRRMFNWIGNTLVTTYWQKIDFPINQRLIDTVVDSANIFLNGLQGRGFILGGRVEFLQEENPTTDLIDGIIRFHVYVTPPAPAREISFILEYDPQYLQTLFG